jgi:hypothetical protein
VDEMDKGFWCDLYNIKRYRSNLKECFTAQQLDWILDDKRQQERCVIAILRWTLLSGHIRQDKVWHRTINKKNGVALIVEKMAESYLRWFGHVYCVEKTHEITYI